MRKEKHVLESIVQFRVRAAEKPLIAERAAAAGFTSPADYLRSLALGDHAALRRPQVFTVPVTAAERNELRRRAEAAGYTDIDEFARARLLGKNLEPLTVSQSIIELRRVTSLVTKLYASGDVDRNRSEALLTQTGNALEAVVQAATPLRKRSAASA